MEEKKKNSEDYDGRKIEREREAIKQPQSRPFAAPYIAIVFSKRYDERETGDLYGESLYKWK